MKNLKFTSEEVVLAFANQNGIFIAEHYDHASFPDIMIYSAPEGYSFRTLKNVTAQNTYVQAKSLAPGDDFTKVTGGVWDPSSGTASDWIDYGRGLETYGNFSHVALKKPGSAGLRIAFALTLMERED